MLAVFIKDYNFNTLKQIQFVIAPVNGATITTNNFLDASIGWYQKNEYNTVLYAGKCRKKDFELQLWCSF